MSSIGDLMASLLFLFIITIMLFARRLKDDQKRAEEQRRVAEKTEKFLDEQARLPRVTRDELLEQLERRLPSGVKVKIDKNQGVLHLDDGAVSFVSGTDRFDERGMQSEENIRALARILADVLPCYSAEPGGRADPCKGKRKRVLLEAVFIEGHTDQRQIRGPWGNWNLSTQRAIRTYRTLLGERRDPLETLVNQDQQRLLSVSGYADTRPVHSGEALSLEEQYRQDRRIDLRFIMAPLQEFQTEPGRDVERNLGTR
jgi:chemotaxis protein MotB